MCGRLWRYVHIHVYTCSLTYLLDVPMYTCALQFYSCYYGVLQTIYPLTTLGWSSLINDKNRMNRVSSFHFEVYGMDFRNYFLLNYAPV